MADKYICEKAVNATYVSAEGAYFAVKHLVSSNNVQLNTVKVIPGETERKRGSRS